MVNTINSEMRDSLGSQQPGYSHVAPSPAPMDWAGLLKTAVIAVRDVAVTELGRARAGQPERFAPPSATVEQAPSRSQSVSVEPVRDTATDARDALNRAVAGAVAARQAADHAELLALQAQVRTDARLEAMYLEVYKKCVAIVTPLQAPTVAEPQVAASIPASEPTRDDMKAAPAPMPPLVVAVESMPKTQASIPASEPTRDEPKVVPAPMPPLVVAVESTHKTAAESPASEPTCDIKKAAPASIPSLAVVVENTPQTVAPTPESPPTESDKEAPSDVTPPSVAAVESMPNTAPTADPLSAVANLQPHPQQAPTYAKAWRSVKRFVGGLTDFDAIYFASSPETLALLLGICASFHPRYHAT